MEAIGPSTHPGLGPHEPGSEGAAPDTIRDGTAPLLAPHRVATVPMAITAPLAAVARRPARLTYDVYTPDDTLRGARALTEADAAHATKEREKRRRIGLGALGLAVTLGTTLMAIGSCDDSATGRVETTAAVATVTTVTARPATPPPAATPAATADDVIPPITFSPPLSPPPRRRGPAHAPKR